MGRVMRSPSPTRPKWIIPQKGRVDNVERRVFDLTTLPRYLLAKEQIASRLACLRVWTEKHLETDYEGWTQEALADLEMVVCSLVEVCLVLGLSLEQTRHVIGDRGMAVIYGMDPDEPLLTPERLKEHRDMQTRRWRWYELAGAPGDERMIRPGHEVKPSFARRRMKRSFTAFVGHNQ